MSTELEGEDCPKSVDSGVANDTLAVVIVELRASR